MARFFFDTFNGSSSFRDRVGVDLDDRVAAYRQATQGLAELMLDWLTAEPPEGKISMVVREESSDPFLRLTLVFEVTNAT